MTPIDRPASTCYELCTPVRARRWGLKAAGALVVALLLQDDPGFHGGSRFRIRERSTGRSVYEITTSVGGLDAQEAEVSISRDLQRLNVEDFETEYSIGRGHDR